MSDFYLTRMGQKFFNADVPRLIRVLERIADTLEKGAEQNDDANEGES